MKSFILPWTAALGLMFSAAGCAHLDVSPSGNPDRVLRGTVNLLVALPAGTEVLVRLIEVAPAETAGLGTKSDLPLGDRGRPVAGERVLGEYRQSLETTSSGPLEFRLEYQADDSVLRHGLNLDVRISFGGRVRYRTIQAHVVTLASSPFPQTVAVQPLP